MDLSKKNPLSQQLLAQVTLLFICPGRLPITDILILLALKWDNRYIKILLLAVRPVVFQDDLMA